MKIGFLGNMNNYPFMLARALKKMRHEVVFVIHYDEKNKLCRPENRYDDISYPYPSWIIEKKLPVLIKYIFSNSKYVKELKAILNECDIVFMNDTGHLFSSFLKKDLIRINMSTGSDLEVSADYRSTVQSIFQYNSYLKSILKIPLKLYSVYLHRKGFQKANIISYFPKGINPDGDSKLQKLMGKNNISLTWLQMAELDYKVTKLPNNTIPVVFNATRFEWGDSSKILNQWSKGNNIMIKGLAFFYKQTQIELDIHFVEKGSSVDATKELIKTEGIEHLVTWHKEMTQKEVQEMYEKSDILFEQLGTHFVGMAGLDGLAMGRPVIANARKEIFDPLLEEESKFCNATTPEEVCEWLHKLVQDNTLKYKIVQEGREYVEKYFSAEFHAKKFLNILKKRGAI